MYALIHQQTGEYFIRTGETLGNVITSNTCMLMFLTKEIAEFNQKLLSDFDLIHVDVIIQKL